MKLRGPDPFALTFDKTQFQVRAIDGDTKFRGRASERGPKLYVFSINGHPIYVGVTEQPIRSRLRSGWKAKGESGYHGYAFRRTLKRANLDIWYLDGFSNDNAMQEAKTIEAEIVFRIRSSGQWPKFQTEIHFYPSKANHRKLAEIVFRHYKNGEQGQAFIS